MLDTVTTSDPLREDLRTAVQTLSTTVQALTQATQLLLTTSDRLLQVLPALPAGAPAGPAPGAAAAQINVWEDDPFSEAVATTDPQLSATTADTVPAVAPANLRWQIGDPRPAPGQFATGSREFRYWNTEASMGRGVTFWSASVPNGTRWTTFNPILPVALNVGQRLNARYRRIDGLGFFEQSVSGVSIASCDSPDVVCHELGHAVLDAIRPELFDASSTEVDAFHEAFGDMSAILVALQIPSMRTKVLSETGGRLNTTSRLSRVAEQLGWGIRQLSRDAVDRDCLRNAANRFFYRPPSTLPPEAPASMLSTEPHSFARVFTGAFLDALDGMLAANGGATETALEMVSRDMRQLLVDAILTASITDEYYSQVAAAMVQAAHVRQNGRYRPALLRAFVERGILALNAVNNLERASVPRLRPSAPGADDRGMTGFREIPGQPSQGSASVLAYDDGIERGFEHDASTAPGLPLVAVAAEFFDVPVLMHAPIDPPAFAVGPVTRGMTAARDEDRGAAAKRFLEDLIHRGRLDPGPAAGIVGTLGSAGTPRQHRTHKLERTEKGLVLKRLQFDCCSRHA